MFFEVHISLQQALERICGDYQLSVEQSEKVLNLLETEELPDLLLKANPRFSLGISTNIAFKLQKYLEEIGAVRGLLSIEVGQKIVETLKITDSQKFEVSLGGAGFINTLLPLSHLTELLLSFLVVDGQKYYSKQSFVRPDGIIKNTLYSKLQVEVNWSDLVSRCYQDRREGIDEFLKGVKTELNQNNKLMLLAILGDKEIDLEIFLRDLKGSENVSWYVQKYLYEVEKYLTMFRDDQDCRLEIDAPLPIYLKRLMLLLLTFRHKLFVAGLHKKPEIFFSLLFEMIKEFYKIYNQPKYRFPEIEKIDLRERKVLFLLLSQTQFLIRTAVQFLCQ
ncbi:MAG: hypothetical protein KBC84_03065 [Proteobacteria bacterium]|nr:hypothetical protein [Pseudomonadota bacterium]